MYPPNRVRALTAHMQSERALSQLTLAAYEQWLPHARDAVLPSLTAAAPDLPPDPYAIVQSQAWWELALDQLLMRGLGLVYGYEMFTVLDALGDTSDLPMDDGADTVTVDNSTGARKARRIVGESLGLATSAITELARRIERTPAVRTLQRRYLADVRNRMVGTPDAVFRDISRELDDGLAAGESIEQQRARVQRHLSVATGDWTGRASLVARTETAGAMSAATVEAAQLRNDVLGEQLEQTWICTLDSRTRKSHFAADGQRVELGGRFKVGRTELRFPGDPRGPVSETANCRCRVAVLAVDEDLPKENDRHTERGEGDSTVRNRSGSQADEIERRAREGTIRAREDPDGLGRVASVTPTEEELMDPDEITEGPETFRTFTDAVIAVLGTPTDDRRILAADMTLTFRDFPLPLMWTEKTGYGHENAFTIGVLESARVEGNQLLASGYLLNTEEADNAANEIGHGVTGPSVDLGDAEWVMTDVEGNEITEEMWWAAEEAGEPLKIYETVTAARLMGVTLVSTPAFGETTISLDAERSPRDISVVASLTAGAPSITTYAPELFADPQLDGPTPITYDAKTGRIFGHLACFGTCHVGFTDRCVTAPRSLADYRHFHTSPPVTLTDGTRLPVGRLANATGHTPDDRASAAEAVAHYDNTSTCFALVRVGEDAHGIWVSGVRAPGITDDQFAAGIAAPLSGDWRQIGGNLELVAALAVNTPGFPITASGATDDMDRPLSLVASLAPRRETRSGRTPSVEAIAAAVVRQMRQAERNRVEAAAIIERHKGKRRAEAMALIEKVRG